jgi:magnesium chelatase subunit D
LTPYPFSAVVGLDDLRLGLLLNAVSPVIGGVLVRGEKGTAKSTMVRALSALLPPVPVVPGCRFSCDPATPFAECPDGPHHVPEAPVQDSGGTGSGGTASVGPGSVGLGSAGPGSVGPVAAEVRPARLVELPVGAAEDRLVGSLDLGRALTEGVSAYQPGLLAAAHRGVLYVDEVNLLHDHLVDLLLDAAALGVSYVEREGVSVRHAARFLLVGTMNPEEGELRPQLLDRFGLTVQVSASRDPEQRVEVVRRRLAYDADPAGFAASWQAADAGLAARIAAARDRLPAVLLPDAELRRIARVCAAFEVDGLRADVVCARTAVALAAWYDRPAVTEADVRRAAELALPHRCRRNPFDEPGLDHDLLDEALAGAGEGLDEPPPDPPPTDPPPDDPPPDRPPPDRPAGDQPSPDRPAPGQPPPNGHRPEGAGPPDRSRADQPAGPQPPVGAPGAPGAGESVAPVGATYPPRLLAVPRVGAGAAGRRSRARTPTGRTVSARRPVGDLAALHLLATLRAAAPHQRARGRTGTGLRLRRDDLREAVREGREGNLVLFCVDASGSMAARDRMSAVKGAVLSLLLDAYQRRDKVGLVTFRGSGAAVTLPPTSSVEVGARRLAALPTGGRTPLAAGLSAVDGVLRCERIRDPRRRPLVVLLTDGRATYRPTPAADPVAEALAAARRLRRAGASSPQGHRYGTDRIPPGRAGVACVVVDCEQGPVRLGLAGRLAAELGGTALRLADLAAGGLVELVRRVA